MLVARIIALAMIVVTVLFQTQPLFAQEVLSEEGLFRRCYAHLTQLRPKLDDPLLAQVRAGTKTAIEACQETFNRALFTADGGTRIQDPNDPVARSIVHTFNELHRSWAREQGIFLVDDDGMTLTGSETWYEDSPYGPYVTRALFSPSFNADSIIQGTAFLQPVRQTMDPPHSYQGIPNADNDWRLGSAHPFAPKGDILGVRSVSLNPVSVPVRMAFLSAVPDFTTIGVPPTGTQSLTQVNFTNLAQVRGPLISQYGFAFAIKIQGQVIAPASGFYRFFIEVDDGAYMKLNDGTILNFNFVGEGTSSYVFLSPGSHNIEIGFRQNFGEAKLILKWESTAGITKQVVPAGNLSGLSGQWFTQELSPGLKFTENAGGGFLGNYNYFLTTYQHGDSNFRPDGALKTDRGYGRAVFSDALCREVPVIRESDALPFVIPESPLTFRRSASCLTCHVSLDGGISGLIRGLYNSRFFSISQDPPLLDLWGTLVMGIQSPTLGNPPAWSDQADSNYPKYNPHGRFRFRNMNGNYIDVPVTSLEELGAAIRSQDDYYVCLAKRYYHYFTGIDVYIDDPGKPFPPELNASELHHQAKVIQLGTELKNTKSLPQLIFSIIGSDEYRATDYRISYQGGGSSS